MFSSRTILSIFQFFFPDLRLVNHTQLLAIGTVRLLSNYFIGCIERRRTPLQRLMPKYSRITAPHNLRIVGELQHSPLLTSLLSQPIYIQCLAGVEIDSSVYIGPFVSIVSANHDTSDLASWKTDNPPIQIKPNVWIGSNVAILPGVIIGNSSVIGAGSVVTKSIPSESVAFGNPCQPRPQR